MLELVLPSQHECRLHTAAEDTALVSVIADSLREGVEAGHTAIFDEGEELAVRAGERGVHVLVLAGTPLAEPIAQHGPFVMNTDEQIREAIDAYRSGTLLGDSGRGHALGAAS
ncbi:MAG: hypothetical protein H7A12_08725 [Pseudomonadales bacterium]|nr:hypothetical protein [Pseudomonadales bacterium]